MLCTIRKVTLFWFYVCFLIFHIFCSFWVMGVFVKTLSFDFWLSRENYKLRKESCDNFFFVFRPIRLKLVLDWSLYHVSFFILNNILALCCKTGGKLRKKMKNFPKMPFFASKYFFLLDGSRLFFKLYMVWKMHSIQHEQYKMSLNYHHLAKCSFSSFQLAKMA